MILQPSVPNWLREEIIKKKAVIATSAPDFSEDPNSVAEDVIDKSFVKGDPDSRSIDSSRSTEEEDDEEVSSLPLTLFTFVSTTI